MTSIILQLLRSTYRYRLPSRCGPVAFSFQIVLLQSTVRRSTPYIVRRDQYSEGKGEGTKAVEDRGAGRESRRREEGGHVKFCQRRRHPRGPGRPDAYVMKRVGRFRKLVIGHPRSMTLLICPSSAPVKTPVAMFSASLPAVSEKRCCPNYAP